MPKRLLVHDAAARKLALGLALAGLMLSFVAASLVVFPYKAAANPEVRGEVLYELLGHLQYSDDGRFTAVDDPAMQQRLALLLLQNRLTVPGAAAYIVELAQGTVVWSASPKVVPVEGSAVEPGYGMQFLHTGGQPLVVQNFWLNTADGSRREFRMVLALPAN